MTEGAPLEAPLDPPEEEELAEEEEDEDDEDEEEEEEEEEHSSGMMIPIQPVTFCFSSKLTAVDS